MILTACATNEDSWETPSLGHSDFSYFILEALSQFEATDTNNDNWISAEEIFEYVKPEVIAFELTRDTIQTPQIGDYYSGELVLFGFVEVTLNTMPSNVSGITIDGVKYSSLPEEFTWIVGTAHTFGVESTQVQVSEGVRLSFSSWSDGTTSP